MLSEHGAILFLRARSTNCAGAAGWVVNLENLSTMGPSENGVAAAADAAGVRGRALVLLGTVTEVCMRALAGLISLVALGGSAVGNEVTVYVYDTEGKLRDDVSVGYSINGAEIEKATFEAVGVFRVPEIAGAKLTLNIDSISTTSSDHGVADIVLDGSASSFATTLDGQSVTVRPISDRALVDMPGNSGPSGAPGRSRSTAASCSRRAVSGSAPPARPRSRSRPSGGRRPPSPPRPSARRERR